MDEAALDEAERQVLVEGIDAALASGQSGRLASSQAAAIEACWTELTIAVPNPPERFEIQFRHGLGDALNWFDGFGVYLADRVKKVPEFRAILVASQLSELRGAADRIEAALKTGFDALPDMLDDRFRQADAEAERRHQEMLAAVGANARRRAEDEGLSQAQVENLLAAFAYEGVPPEQAEQRLLESARQLVELQQRLSQLSNDEPEITALMQAAAEAIEATDLDRADYLLSRAEAADLEAGERRIGRAAENRAKRGALARSRARWLEAADHYGRAAEMVVGFDSELAWYCRLQQADILDDHGKLFPGPTQAEAARIWRDLCLPHTPATRGLLTGQ